MGLCVGLVCSPRRRLQLLTALAGGAFVYSVVEAPAFAFTQLPHAFPTGFRKRRGFFHVLRWLEQLDDADELSAFLEAMAAFQSAPPSEEDRHVAVLRTASQLLAHLRRLVAWETYLLVSKMGLQWGLLVFLSRAKAVTTRVAIPCVCLSILSLLCTKMAQSAVVEMLSQTDRTSPRSVALDKQKDRAAFMAAFLGLLFWVRLAAMAVVNAVLARAYQSFFGGWPPPRWKDVPRYIGSKNFALSTLFYAVAGVSVMAVSASSLRSLAEAAHHIESLALVAAFGHFLAHESGLTAPVAQADPAKEKAKTA